jgi:MoxR-like ATPase
MRLEVSAPAPAVAAQALIDNVRRVVVAREETLRLAAIGLFCDGHILLEDVPGVGKTLLAKTLAASIEATFKRIQFTPDLLPADITGGSIFNQGSGDFTFVAGPIFANIVLADEVNRATPRTQSALLEAMAERQVSADGVTYPLPRPFCVIATENPIETYGTFPLPEAQLDRFLLAMRLGYPDLDQTVEILDREEHNEPTAGAILAGADVLRAQAAVRAVNVANPVKRYIAALAEASRHHTEVALGVSPRGAVALQRAAQGWAALSGRDFVLPDDVKVVATAVLGHRLVCRSGRVSGSEIIEGLLRQVPVPL